MLKATLKDTPASSVIFGLIFLIAGFCLYGSAGHDDSHITFWASYSLVEFGEILNYNGERVEQSSSLLLTLLTALFTFISFGNVVTVGYLITIFCGALTLVLAAILARRINPINLSPSLLFLASSPAFLLWSFSGMESSLAALCMVWFVLSWGDLLDSEHVDSRNMLITSVATMALLMVRPEMMIFLACVVLAFYAWKRITGLRGSVQVLVFYSTVLLSISLLLAFRFIYFDQPFPQPVYAKVSPLTAHKLYQGLFYFIGYGLSNIVILISFIGSLLYLLSQLKHKQSDTSPHLVLTLLCLLGYSAFVIFSGGDWMQMGRFFVPVLPLACILTTLYLQSIIKNHYGFIIAVVAICIANTYGNLVALKKHSHGTPIWASYRISEQHQQRYSMFEQYNQEHLRDMEVIDTLDRTISHLIESQPLTPVTLMSGQSGMVFFYTAKNHFRQVTFFDNRALIEDSLIKCELIDNVPRSNQGLFFSFDEFFELQPQLAEQCDIPVPDLLYDINDMTRQLHKRMENHNYTLIHKEGGKVLQNNTSIPTFILPAPNFIMLNNDLLDVAGKHSKKTTVRYHEKNLVPRALAPSS